MEKSRYVNISTKLDIAPFFGNKAHSRQLIGNSPISSGSMGAYVDWIIEGKWVVKQ